LHLFLDDGGVISQSAPRAAQWERLVGEYFSPRLGGDSKAWAEANREVMKKSWREGGFGDWAVYYDQISGLRDEAWDADLDAHFTAWVSTMCDLVGVPPPADSVALADAACIYVTERVTSPFPDVIDAVHALAERGYALHTASGERSIELDGYLRALGVRHLFGTQLFGTDLVRIPKAGPEFYARIFSSVGIEATAAVVIDDSPLALGWAAEAGARIFLIDRASSGVSDGPTITSLRELLSLLP
jgi:beta-phosphoglucomutase-like phosphatase (HAD superfamily)